MMLERLMSILKRGGALTLDQIARELDTTPEMAAQLVEFLERSDQLKQIDQNCQSQCAGCYLAEACDHRPRNRIWLN